MKKGFTCSKCGGNKAELDEIRTTGSGFTRYFNIQNRKFTVVSCSRCGFTELYKSSLASNASNLVDFLTN